MGYRFEVEVDIDDITLECDKCGGPINATWDEYHEKAYIVPCSDCLTDAEEDGRSQGYDEGEGDGYSRGYDDGVAEAEA